MTDKKEHIKHSMKSTAPADCVTEIRIGNSVLVVSGFFKQSATETAADKMAKVLEAEAATQKSAIRRAVKKHFSHFAAIHAAPPCGTIEVRNSGAGCQKRRKPC